MVYFWFVFFKCRVGEFIAIEKCKVGGQNLQSCGGGGGAVPREGVSTFGFLQWSKPFKFANIYKSS
jgi:hypothetical protein